MPLTDTVHDWLSGNLDGTIQRDDLDRTYAFPHRLNARREVTRQCVEKSGPEESALWNVEFFDEAGATILDCGHTVARRVLARARLYGKNGATGTVAYNATLYLRQDCRLAKFAKSLYGSELELYVRWGIREIQLRAHDDGPVVWVQRFNFQPTEPELLRYRYRDWARTHREAAPEPPSRPADYPAPFLSRQQGLMLYKVLP
jgi:hypothetical protein